MKFWTGIVTERVVESCDFYVAMFGCPLLFEGEDNWFVLLGLGNSELAFMKPGLSFQGPMFRKPLASADGLWISVDVDDAKAEYQRLQDLGVTISQELRDEPWGDRHFVIMDPNGIALDIVEHRQDS